MAVREVPVISLGFGNVGQAMARLIEENDGYRREGVRLVLHAVFDRRGGVRTEGRDLASLLEAKRRRGSVTALDGGKSIEPVGIAEALEADGAILVDTSITDAATGEPGFTAAKRALERGRPVVFASKGPLVARYRELLELATRSGARIGAAAAVGIPLPSLEVGLHGLRGAGLHRFRAVLNDTTNQILRDLESGISLDEAVERARIAGTIEEDPRLDLDGWDAAYKLLILARAIWDPGLDLDDVRTTGVSGVGKKELDEARLRRQRIRLIATGERGRDGKIRLETAPESLGEEDALYGLGPGEKGAVFETEDMGSVTLVTSQGGPVATAACVIKDILNIAAPPPL